jgi:sulfatase modifying factor 1
MRRLPLGLGILTAGIVLLSGLGSAPTEASADPQLVPVRIEPGGAKMEPGVSVAPFARPVLLAADTVCPNGMVEVEGDYCPTLEQKCVRWVDPDTRRRCAEFAHASRCLGKTVKKHVCVDRYEYPNRPDDKPTVMVTWEQAESTCESDGKRLCTASEWTLACEGQERLPYPYGYERDAGACNIDRPHRPVDEAALESTARREAEAARLDQREPSGAHEACTSPYGVHDMTGNVDEWVVNESKKPHKSGLKGGYWGPVRDRCRPITTAHGEAFAYYQIGFRCCSDPGLPAQGT